jgi:hypothetical protein
MKIFVFSIGFSLYFAYSREAANFFHQKMMKEYGEFISPVWEDTFSVEDKITHVGYYI